MMRIVISRDMILHSIADLAWVTADLRTDSLNGHVLHQTADICTEANLPRVDTLIRLALTEALEACRGAFKVGTPFFKDPPAKSFTVDCRCGTDAARIRELLKEFLTASVLCSWLSLTIPEAAAYWKERASECLTKLAASGQMKPHAHRRTIPPI